MASKNVLNIDKEYGRISAFGEQLVAEYFPLAAWTFSYNVNEDFVTVIEENGGTVTHEGAFAVLNSGTDPNGVAGIRTKAALRYIPRVGGKGAFTHYFNEPQENNLAFTGVGELENGLFFGYDGTEFGVFVVNDSVFTFYPQTQWTHRNNLDEDFTPQRLNVFQIQFQWLGGGEIRFFIENKEVGAFLLVHLVQIANTGTDVSIQNPTLPISSYSINNGNTIPVIVRTPSGSAGIEGRPNDVVLTTPGHVQAELDNADQAGAPILTLRNKSTYEGKENTVRLKMVDFAASTTGSRPVFVTAIKNATLTGASFSDVNAGRSPAEVDTSATAITGGTFVGGFALGERGNNDQDLSKLALFLTAGESLTIFGRTATGGTNDFLATLTYENQF
jgi:hypothetical protein